MADEINLLKAKEVAPMEAVDLNLEAEKGIEDEREVESGKLKVEGGREVEEVKEVKEAGEVQEGTSKVRVQEPTQVPIVKDPMLVNIESILAEDLTDVFLELPDDRKLAFKQKGEEIAVKIIVMIESGKVKVGKILGWIQEWLQMIPGVNKYFINQESKIAADKIMRFAQEQKKQVQNKV